MRRVKLNLNKMMGRFVSDLDYRTLFLEQLLFSIILGASLHSLPLFCLSFTVLLWVLHRQKGLIYMVYVLSSIWAMLALVITYCFSGPSWWPVVSGTFAFIYGLVIHFRDLKGLHKIPVQDIELPMNWNRLNLN